MKNRIKYPLLIVASLCVIASAFIGCTTTPGTVSTVQVPTTIPVYSTTPVIITFTNFVAQTVTQTNGVIVTTVQTNVVNQTNMVTQTNYQSSIQTVLVTNQVAGLSPTVTGSINMAQQAAPFIPPPYNALVDPVLGLATAISLFFVKRKQTQLNAATAESAKHQAAAQALAAAVNAGGATTIAAAHNNAMVNGSTAGVAVHLADASKPV